MHLYTGVEPQVFYTGPSGSDLSGLRLSAERIRRAFVLGGRGGNTSNAAAGEADRAPIMSQQQEDIVSSEDYGETTDDELIGKKMEFQMIFQRLDMARKDVLSKSKKRNHSAARTGEHRM